MKGLGTLSNFTTQKIKHHTIKVQLIISSSDMDELCDPEYYLNYNSNTAPLPPPRRQEQHAGTRSVQLPRKKMNFDAVTYVL